MGTLLEQLVYRDLLRKTFLTFGVYLWELPTELHADSSSIEYHCKLKGIIKKTVVAYFSKITQDGTILTNFKPLNFKS